jgi:hypothetical protein
MFISIQKAQETADKFNQQLSKHGKTMPQCSPLMQQL